MAMDKSLRRKRCRGNLKPAPFSMTAGVVRGVLDLADSKGVAEVPVVDVKLVDRPRRSEDPRLAKANDDAPLAVRPRKLDIDLASVPSAMEQLAESWKGRR